MKTHHQTHIYEVTLKSTSNEPITFFAYGLHEITGKMSKLDMNLLRKLFPRLDVSRFQRSENIDLLLGSDYTGVHPRKEVAQAGHNLLILEGPLGQCLQGRHPNLQATQLTSQFTSIEVSVSAKDSVNFNHKDFSSASVHFTKVEEGRIGHVAVADIRKIDTSIHISPIEQHCNLEDRKPEVYIITRDNMGDCPVAAIRAEAIYKTDDMVEPEHPDVSHLLKQSTYVNDVVHSVSTKEEVVKHAKSTTAVLNSAGFAIKHWLFSGECEPRKDLEVEINQSDVNYKTQVLGIHWEPYSDKLLTEVKLNFSTKKKVVYTQPNLILDKFPASILHILTRRSVLEQSMKLYDPFGLYCAFSLKWKWKWKTTSRNLRPGDIVSVADTNALRGSYYFAQVHEVFPSCDVYVRKVSLGYKNFRVGEKVHEYKGSKDVIVYRSVQKLALLVPIDEASE